MDHNSVTQHFDKLLARSRLQRVHDIVAMTHATPTSIRIQREAVVFVRTACVVIDELRKIENVNLKKHGAKSDAPTNGILIFAYFHRTELKMLAHV